MHLILLKTFGGLSLQYYLRHFIFGLIFPLIFITAWINLSHTKEIQVSAVIAIMTSTILYPYARYVYEGIIGFIVGENIFIVNAYFAISMKFLTMFLCWLFSVFIAPVGLAYLYYYHSKAN